MATNSKANYTWDQKRFPKMSFLEECLKSECFPHRKEKSDKSNISLESTWEQEEKEIAYMHILNSQYTEKNGINQEHWPIFYKSNNWREETPTISTRNQIKNSLIGSNPPNKKTKEKGKSSSSNFPSHEKSIK